MVGRAARPASRARDLRELPETRWGGSRFFCRPRLGEQGQGSNSTNGTNVTYKSAAQGVAVKTKPKGFKFSAYSFQQRVRNSEFVEIRVFPGFKKPRLFAYGRQSFAAGL